MYGHGTVIFINEIAFSRAVYDTLILSIVIIILLRHDDQFFLPPYTKIIKNISKNNINKINMFIILGSNTYKRCKY